MPTYKVHAVVDCVIEGDTPDDAMSTFLYQPLNDDADVEIDIVPTGETNGI